MNKINFPIASILFVFWAVEYFAFDAGSIIHILLVAAAISLLLIMYHPGKTRHR